MKVIFLGTGTSQGIPVIGSDHPVCKSLDIKDKRLRSSILIQINNLDILIDCSPDFRQQILRTSCSKLDAILFTHEHADHTMGLDDIRPFYFKQGAIMVHAHKRVLSSLAKRFDYIFNDENKYPGAPSVNQNEIKEGTHIQLDQLEIIPINCWHGTLQVFGFRIHDFAYLTDVKSIDDKELEKLKQLDVLVINALRIEAHHSHFNLAEALDFITLLAPKKAYLTHISHLLGFHSEVEKILPKNVFLAYDNLEIVVK